MLAIMCYAIIFAVLGSAAGYLPAVAENDNPQEFYEVVYHSRITQINPSISPHHMIRDR